MLKETKPAQIETMEKTFKVIYVSDKKSIFFEKGKEYEAFLPKDNKSGKWFAFHIEDIEEPGDYAFPAGRFLVADE